MCDHQTDNVDPGVGQGYGIADVAIDRARSMVVDVQSGMASKLQAIANSSPKDLETSMKVAAQRLGFSELKKQQENAVKATLCGKDVFVSLPTGFGKSLIYQILPVCAEELAVLKPVGSEFKPFVLIVSPLISLMQA